MIFTSHQRHKGGNRDYCSHFILIFETASKFLIFFVRLILAKVGVDGFTGPRGEIDIRYELNLKIILTGLEYKWRFLQTFFIEFPSNNLIYYCFCQIDVGESWVDGTGD